MTETPPQRPSFVEWQSRLMRMEGYRAISLQQRVRRIAYIFQGNVRDYKTLVARLQETEFALSMLSERTHEETLGEIERLLHNVLMALSTRIDQQRAFMQRNFSDDTQLGDEYQERIKASFTSDTSTCFLRELRNYITHNRLPVSQSRQTFSTQTYSATFTLPCAPLLEWSKWSTSVRSWIHDLNDDVAIVDVVDNYARKAGTFDHWLFDRIREKYITEILEFEREHEEYARQVDRFF